MSSETRFTASRSLGRSSIPITISAQPTRTAPEPGLNNFAPHKNNAENDKFVYTDGDVQEHPPEGNATPIIALPGDNATNRAVKAYLLDVLTKTGWGLALESAQEIRATINSFVGNGWALRNRYVDNTLHNICPLHITAIEDGVAIKRKVSASVRSNIGKCIMREMERYFEGEDQARVNPQNASDGGNTLVNGSRDSGTSIRRPCHGAAEQIETQQFRKRLQSRATLPDEWMSESLRTRTQSRLSQYSEDQPPPRPRPIRIKYQPVYISKTSAYPMLVDVTNKPQRTKSVKGIENTSHNSLQPGGRQTASGTGNVRTSTYKRDSFLNPYYTIPGSSLPRPASSLVFRSVSRAAFTRHPTQPTQESKPAQNLVSDTSHLASSTTPASDAPANDELTLQTEVRELDDSANEDVGATAHATAPNTDDHSDTANIAVTDEHRAIAGSDDKQNTGDAANATETDTHPTTASHDDNKTTDNDTPLFSTKEYTKLPRTRRPISPELEYWIQTLPPLGPQPMTLPPSPPNVYKDVPAELDTMAPGLLVYGPDEYGDIATINDIPVGSKTRKIAEREVEEARARTEEATAGLGEDQKAQAREAVRSGSRNGRGLDCGEDGSADPKVCGGGGQENVVGSRYTFLRYWYGSRSSIDVHSVVEIFERIETACLLSDNVQRAASVQKIRILSRFPSWVAQNLTARYRHKLDVSPHIRQYWGGMTGARSFSQCDLEAKPEKHGLALSNRG
ncbi:hypothetical protein P171DRAFT_492678 [Karstenula rhodostoma CBS 690.94]|uniref:Uncharacterized protein n=1 Tax=Karstenula rhodostoma CBS 690.94 TaxID=1392251 RepID=A0A9P4PYU6_9PLEO|nr:hypothetical protein P171DRAFT_492678 [Karstenula rhodostoma CBS 690.94]